MRPDPIVSASSVTSGRCCPYATPLIATHMTNTSVVSCIDSPSSSAVEEQGDGTIVHELDVHVGLKLAGLHLQLQRAKLQNERFVDRTGRCRALGLVEGRTTAAATVAAQRELRHGKHRAMHIGDRQVHLSSSIVEHA